MLRRFSSNSSFSTFMRPSTSTSSDPSIKSFTSSSLAEALNSPLPPLPSELIDPNTTLITSLEALQICHRSAYGERLSLLLQVQQILMEKVDTRNTFREHGGFLNAVSIIASLEEASLSTSSSEEGDEETKGKEREDRKELRYEIVKIVFNILALTFENHDLNRANFSETVGFEAIGEAIKLSGLMALQQGEEEEPQPSPQEKLLSILYSFLINDFNSSSSIYSHLKKQLEDLPTPPVDLDSTPTVTTSDTPTTTRTRTTLINSVFSHRSSDEVASNPEVIPLLLTLQSELPSSNSDLRLAILLSLLRLANTSRRSQVVLNEAGLVGIALERLFPLEADGEQGEEREVLRELTKKLLEMGAGTKEMRTMFKGVVEGWQTVDEDERLNEEMLSLILDGVRQSRIPSFIHFDFSQHGHSSLSLRSLGRTFPPPTHGYTFLAWLNIQEPPSTLDERLIIFGCGDATGKCHVEAFLTPDLKLSLQTSLSKPPCTFPNFTFEVGKFYHVAIVHQRPKFSSTSPVSLYIDGTLADSAKALYPVAPHKDWEVQGWLGTPKDRLPNGRLGKGESEMKWDLGPTWLIHGDVPEEMIYVCSALGPRYTSNFQDQLGQFQTNESSTLLNVKLDAATKDAAKNSRNSSALVYAIRDKGSAVIPEHRIFFAFSALNVLVAGSGKGLSGSGLSEHAQQALSLATASRGKVIVNSAIPKIEDALMQPHGLGHLGGDPCVANPRSLDVAIWKVGGVAVALRLVELSATRDQLSGTVKLFLELVSHSWRNSEDAERIQGYEILALHLKTKASILSAETHDALFSFVGFNLEDPAKSVVSNPLAFRFLILDFALWGLAEPALQWAHFDRLNALQKSEHREFNVRRLAKMHLTRKLLFALRANYYDTSMLPEVVDALMCVVRGHFTTETVRHLATFLTATLCQAPSPNRAPGTPDRRGSLFASFTMSAGRRESLQTVNGRRESLQANGNGRRESLQPNGDRRGSLFPTEGRRPSFYPLGERRGSFMPIFEPQENAIDPEECFVLDASKVEQSRFRSSLRVLQGMHDLLLAPEATSELAKFGKIITTKWELLFLLDRSVHPLASVLGLRILVRLLQTQGHAFVSKFTNSSDGFSILRNALPHLWNYGQIHIALFALFHGHDISAIPLDAPFLPSTLTISATETSSVASEVVRIILACVSRGLKTISREESETEVPSFEVTEDTDTPKVEVNDSTPIESTESPSTLTFIAGFDIILDFLGQAGRGSGAVVYGAVPLHDMTSSLRPYLILPTPPEYPPTSDLPSIPIISPRRGYQFTPAPGVASPSPDSSVQNTPLSLHIPATPDFSQMVSPNTANEEEGPLLPFISKEGNLSAAAISLLQFVSLHVTHGITSRHEHRHKGSSPDPASQPSTHPALQPLRDVLTSGASPDVVEQVSFRTILIKDVTRRLSKAPTVPVVSARVAALTSFLTDLSFQGWNSDIRSLLDFVLAYVEKMLDDIVLGTPSFHSHPLEGLFNSLNRLILLAMAQDETDATELLGLLVKNQLSVFAAQNTDPDFVRSLLQRLDHKLRTLPESQQAATIDFFKLVILQRPIEVEAALGQTPRHVSEVPIIAKLLDADNDGFVDLLDGHRTQLNELTGFWTNFVEMEETPARVAVSEEVRRLVDLSKGIKQKKETQKRRTKKQRASVLEWREGIADVEATRVAHTRQDITDHYSFVQTEWQDQLRNLQRECALWGGPSENRRWRLDFTEGHCRMRKKLQADSTQKTKRQKRLTATQTLATDMHLRSMGVTRQDSFSVDPNDLPVEESLNPASPIIPEEEVIWGENFSQPFESANGEVDPGEVFEEDKNRKVRRSLEQGDIIISVFNISRIAGLDAHAGLLLLAKKNIYIVDGFVQTSSGELVDAWDAPEEDRDQHLQTLADLAGRDHKAASKDLDTAHRSRRWAWSDLLEVHERKYLFRNVALELFFGDGRSFLLTFAKEQRPQAYGMIADRNPAAAAFGSLNVVGASFGAKVTDAVLGQRSKLERMTKRWERREVSNFDYLMFLNTCAGRTYNDLTNYPVFPWILADYTSDTLDLTSESTFRDLSKPMGAQFEDRKKEFEDRYQQLMELNDEETKPFHYGTHYSSAMIVVGYLVRLRPFTESYLDLQGGNFDHADRMFWSIAKAWESCSKQSRSDVRELIPEFFYLPNFLRNANGLELGARQETGERIDNVDLPPWANGDPRRFVELHREALESEYVSQKLGSWIDLIFGYRQTGEEAIESVNVFHSLSYEGAIDLDMIEDADKRKAATSTIHNFGMTPRQLFSKVHPARVAPLQAKATRPIFSPDLFIESQTATLIQSIVPIAEIPNQVATIYPSSPEKTIACPTQTLLVPDDGGTHTISWGYADQTVRLHAKGNNLPVSLFENMHSEFVSSACFADSRIFVTGSTDTNVSLWKWRWRSHGKEGHFQQLECLRGHSDQVTCVAASREFSIVVSGSDDRTAIVWDLNRHRFVHSLEGHESRVQLVAISDTTGDIATCSRAVLRVWGVNGDLLAIQSTSNFIDPITSVAFSRSQTAPIVATGHRNGRIMLWKRVASSEPTGWSLKLLQTLKHKDRFSPRVLLPDITSLSFAPAGRTLYSGDSQGKVWLWTPPGTEFFLPDSAGGGACMNCNSKFSLLESRRRCSSCSGIFCTLCTTTSLEVGGRFCASCFSKLSPLMVA